VKLGVVNESVNASLTAPALGEILAAIGRQLSEDYPAFCQEGPVEIAAYAQLQDVPSDVSVLVILDTSDQAGALGYHDTTPDGRPYGKVFLEPILTNGGSFKTGSLSLSVTLSHEALEMAGDPYANWWADGPNQEHALELCDPVEGDSYDIDGVSVSNFVGPRWFSNGPGPYDKMGTLTAPWTMSAGGYMIVRDRGTVVRQVFGESYPEWRKPLKHRHNLRLFAHA
jgi:hypothetical protein